MTFKDQKFRGSQDRVQYEESKTQLKEHEKVPALNLDKLNNQNISSSVEVHEQKLTASTQMKQRDENSTTQASHIMKTGSQPEMSDVRKFDESAEKYIQVKDDLAIKPNVQQNTHQYESTKGMISGSNDRRMNGMGQDSMFNEQV